MARIVGDTESPLTHLTTMMNKPGLIRVTT